MGRPLALAIVLSATGCVDRLTAQPCVDRADCRSGVCVSGACVAAGGMDVDKGRARPPADAGQPGGNDAASDGADCQPAGDDATCDGVDDDCDGQVDEAYQPLETHCGVGACAATGHTSCVGGEVRDSCAPGEAVTDDADCDGADDDCDGVTDEDSAQGVAGVEWVCVAGGRYVAGGAEHGVHAVDVPTFEVARTEVTVDQYAACVAEGACTASDVGGLCNRGVAGRGDHPVNCVDWAQAATFAVWVGGRLPSEAEWEYAARSRGQEQLYPWGDAVATCERAVMSDLLVGGDGCGLGTTGPSCSKPPGNTAQGLCDMAGNVLEWVEDWYGRPDLAPTDGSARTEPGPTNDRVYRGSSWSSVAGGALVVTRRYGGPPSERDSRLGFRVARSHAGIKWVHIEGGQFVMGTEAGEDDERPVRAVNVPDFELSRTEVTVDQYAACVSAGVCGVPDVGDACNWGLADRGSHPVNCVDWAQAVTFAAWAGGRLPSEAEWEYAARSRGHSQNYPWGDAPPTCERAVADDPNAGGAGCGANSTRPTCSRFAGNTAQGLCDMAGNVWEWVEDWSGPYDEAPTDGSARTEQGATEHRVLRGGGWRSDEGLLRAARRGGDAPSLRADGTGFRVARPPVLPATPASPTRPAMVAIPGGEFLMGSPAGEGLADEHGPDGGQVRVSISRFLLSQTEVTQGQWFALIATRPSAYPGCGDDCPVETISWFQAVSFCNALSVSEGLVPAYDVNGTDVRWNRGANGYRLPTEAEWEYAARAGTVTDTYNGDLTVRGARDAPELDPIASYGGNSRAEYPGAADCSSWPERQYPDIVTCGPQPVGTKRPNPWGLFDMLGSVVEWTWDVYDAYPTAVAVDPSGPEVAPSGQMRMGRGGGWNLDDVTRARAPHRTPLVGPEYRDHALGFRLARSSR